MRMLLARISLIGAERVRATRSEESVHALHHRGGIEFIEVEQHWHLVFSSCELAAQVEFTTIEPGSANFRFIL